MIYIEQDNNELIKYEVIFNEENLRRIKNEIMYDCAIIMPKCFTASYEMNLEYNLKIRNFKKELMGYKNKGTEKVYKYEYEEYNEPRLCTLIERLLNKDTSVIYEIKNPTIIEEEKVVNYENVDLTNINESELSKLRTDLELYQKYLSLNKDHNPKKIYTYYPFVLNLIELKEIDRISDVQYTEIKKVEEIILSLQNRKNILLNKLRPFLEDTSFEYIRKKQEK